jgi:hypothetical protein
MRIHLTDYVVQSLRDMPEHAHLITDWTALLEAIQQDTRINQVQPQETQRTNVAKQRILLRMLATAAALEVGSLFENQDEDEDEGAIDADLVRVKHELQPPSPVEAFSGGKKTKKKKGSSLPQESLTVGLLKALPQLLEAFKGDVVILKSLTKLPQYFGKNPVVQRVCPLLFDFRIAPSDTSIPCYSLLQFTPSSVSLNARKMSRP